MLAVVAGIGCLAGCDRVSDGAGSTVAGPASGEPGTATSRPVDPSRSAGATTSPSGEPAVGDPPTTVAADDYRLREGSLGGDVYFRSPTGNIHCRLGDWTVATAGCQAKEAPVPPGGEKECAGNEIYPASSLSRGYLLYPDRVRPICFNQGYLGAPNAKTLPYNSSVAVNGYTCTSRVEGVTCLTAAGAHGFFMSLQTMRSW